MKKHPLTAEDRELIEIALKTEKAAHDYGIHYRVVACAMRTGDGSIYKGINVGLIHGSCAEFVALGAAIADGKKDFDTCVAVHACAPNNIVSPCGNCRQLFSEYCPEIFIVVNDENGKVCKVRAKELLPCAYTEIKIDQNGNIR